MIVRHQARKDFLVSLSLANLFFIGTWADALATHSPSSYLLGDSTTALMAAMLDVLLLAGALTGAMGLVRRMRSRHALRFAKIVFVASFLIPLDQLRTGLDLLRGNDVLAWLHRASYLLPLLGLSAVALVYGVLRWHASITKAGETVLLVMLPFAGVTFGRALWAVSLEPLAAPSLARDVPRSRRTTRVVWIVFDEMDQRLAFGERPRTVELPELDRLRREALYASNAYPPSNSTTISMPALIMGTPLSFAAPYNDHELLVKVADADDTVRWSEQPNVFSEARSLGVNAAVVGWYHPYCRVLRASLTRCYWEPFSKIKGRGDKETPLFPAMIDEILSVSPWYTRFMHIGVYRRTLDSAQTFASDPTLGLVLLHLPVPHLPIIYDRLTELLTVNNYRHSGYLDNLVLADRTLGLLRRAMIQHGTWENTALIVTADHSFRSAKGLDGKYDPRIPFLLKLAGHSEGISFERPFNTLVTHDLILAILKGELRSPAGVSRWLSSRVIQSPPEVTGTNRALPRPE